jgi:pimeloyl-ACP methyl ester carboxylesterase
VRAPTLIDRGSGPPLVLIPGLQGRCEWMLPTVDALARDFRVLTFTLAGDWGSRQRFDPDLGFDTYVAQIDDVLERGGIETAVMCGVSYGGLIAMRYAARRPQRVSHLVLASAVPPDYVATARYRFYRRAPVLLLPVFFLESAWRVSPEIRCAIPSLTARLRFGVVQGFRVLRAPIWPPHMRQRMELIAGQDFQSDVRHVQAPTLLLTGEPGLDRTLPVELSRRYTELIPGAEHVVLERTGHMGTITRPEAFADAISHFVERAGVRHPAHSQDSRGASAPPRAF